MNEGLDPRKEYEEYLRRVEAGGEPTDPQAEAQIKAEIDKELEQGKKGDYTVLRPESSRKKRIASFPQGRSSEEDLENAKTEGKQMSTAEAIAEIEKMKEMVEGSNAEILALEKAISALSKDRELISSSDEIADKNILLDRLDTLIKEYDTRLQNLRKE